MPHTYGQLPDPEDIRDLPYLPPKRVQLPLEVDHRNVQAPVRNQENQGCCTGFSGAGYLEFLEINALPVTSSDVTDVKKLIEELRTPTTKSPAFPYFLARLLRGWQNQDSGAYIRDVFKVFAKQGCCSEDQFPYDANVYSKEPDGDDYQDAKKSIIAAYYRLSTIADIQDCLAKGNCVVIGFTVYASFESEGIAKTGRMPMPAKGEATLGGHAVLVVGYKYDASYEGGGYFIIKNSWSERWGDNGYFYMPFAFVTSANVQDMWTATGFLEPDPVVPTPDPEPEPIPVPDPANPGCLPNNKIVRSIAKFLAPIIPKFQGLGRKNE